eukprot:7262638-Prymnesium_polylepis.2
MEWWPGYAVVGDAVEPVARLWNGGTLWSGGQAMEWWDTLEWWPGHGVVAMLWSGGAGDEAVGSASAFVAARHVGLCPVGRVTWFEYRVTWLVRMVRSETRGSSNESRGSSNESRGLSNE